MRRSAFCALFLSVTILIITVQRCEIKNPVVDGLVFPVLSNLVVRDTLYLKTPTGYFVSVKVSDPQGWEDIQTVKYFVFPEGNNVSVWQDTLRDNGKEGDIIPRDGVFFDSLTVDFAGGIAGKYRMGMVAEDVAHHSSDTLFTPIAVVDGEENLPPTLFNPVVPDTLREETLSDVFFSIQAADTQGLDDLDLVYFQIYLPWSPVPSFRSELRDDGYFGDAEAGDGIFSFRSDLRDTLKIRGNHFVRFQAVDIGGLKSRAVVVDFYVLRENLPPVLSDLVMPDTVSTSVVQSFLISVRVTDPQGLDDIKKVWFDLTKPDGTPSSSNPVPLFDDGSNGDQTAGDGIYSLQVSISPQNDKGVYRFDFNAEDLSGTISDTLTHYFTVVE